MRKLMLYIIFGILCLFLGSCQKQALNIVQPSIAPISTAATKATDENESVTVHGIEASETPVGITPSSETSNTVTPFASEDLGITKELYVTLETLKATTPDKWEGRYQAYDRNILVNAPITLPQTDSFPVFSLQYKQFDIIEEETRLAVLIDNKDDITLHINYNAGSFGISIVPKSGSRINAPTSASAPYGANTMVKLSAWPDQNEYPPNAPYTYLQSIMSLIGIDISEIELTGQVATTGSYPIKEPNSYVIDTSDYYHYINRNAPVPGYEQGHYELSLHQTLNGVRIFGGIYWLLSSPNGPQDATPHIRMNIVNEEDLYIELKLVEITGIQVTDTPLLPFERIKEIIKQYINYGIIRRIDKIELGYMLFYSEDITTIDASWSTPLIAVPTWQVTGEIVYDSTIDTMPEWEVLTLLLKSGLADSGADELRIHAQSGMVFNRYSSEPIRCMPDIITWDALNP